MSPRFSSFFNCLLLAVGLTMAGTSYSATYTFKAYFAGEKSTVFSSATDACSSLIGQCGAQYSASYRVTSLTSIIPAGDSAWTCQFQLQIQTSATSWENSNKITSCNGITGYASRQGDSCPPGSTYVVSTGSCTAPPPTCTGDSVLNPATNSCDLTCAAPKVPNAATQTCVDPAPNCGPGQYYDFEEQSCLYPEDDNCPPGANYDPAIGACACPSGSQLSVFGQMQTCLPVGDQSDCTGQSADFMGYSQNPNTFGKPLCSGRGRCPDGSKPGYVESGSDATMVCMPETGADPDCPLGRGTFQGHEVCLQNPKNDPRCKPGETSGTYGPGDSQTHVCIPANFLPKTCPPGSYSYNSGPDGGFACVVNSTTEAPKKNPDGTDKPAGSVSGKGKSVKKDAEGKVVETEESELELDFSDLIENAPNDNFKKDLDDFAGNELSDAVDEKDLLAEFAGSDGAFTGRDKLDNVASFIKSHTIGNSTACSGNLPFMGYVVSCDRFAMYNRIMGWFFFVLTIFRIRDCLMRPSASGV